MAKKKDPNNPRRKYVYSVKTKPRERNEWGELDKRGGGRKKRVVRPPGMRKAKDNPDLLLGKVRVRIDIDEGLWAACKSIVELEGKYKHHITMGQILDYLLKRELGLYVESGGKEGCLVRGAIEGATRYERSKQTQQQPEPEPEP